MPTSEADSNSIAEEMEYSGFDFVNSLVSSSAEGRWDIEKLLTVNVRGIRVAAPSW